MSAGAINAGKAVVEISIADKVGAGLDNVQRRLNTWAKGLALTGGAISGAGLSILTPIMGAVKSFIDSGSALADMSARTGVSAEALSELGYAAQQTGTDMGDLEKSLNYQAKFTDALRSGSDKATKTLQRLGISSAQFLAASPTQRLGLLADGLQGISDPSERAALAMATLGKSGTKLIPMLAGGAAGLQAFADRAKELNILKTDDQVAKADRLGDLWDDLYQQFGAIAFNVGAALADTLSAITEQCIRGASAVIAFVQNNQGLIVIAAAAGAVLMVLGGLLIGTGVGIWAVSAALGVVSSVIAFATAAWGMLGTVCSIVAAANTWLAATMTSQGFAAMLASAATWLLNAALAPLAGIATAAGAALAFLASPLGLLVLLFATVAAAAVGWVMFTQTGQAALGHLTAGFWSLLDSAKTAFNGILDAIMSGNWSLAGQIAMAGLNAAWVIGMQTLKQVWIEFKAWMAGSIIDLFGSSTLDGIKYFYDTLVSVFTWIRDFAVEVVRVLWKLFSDIGSEIAKIAGQTGKLVGIDFGNDSAADRFSKKKIEQNKETELSASDKEIKKAQDALAKLTKQAADERLGQEDERKAKAKKRFDTSIMPNLPATSEETGPTGSTFGTFSSFVTGILGRVAPDVSDAKKTAENTDAMKESLEAIQRKIEENEGAVFE